MFGPTSFIPGNLAVNMIHNFTSHPPYLAYVYGYGAMCRLRIVFVRSHDGSLATELSNWADASLKSWLLTEIAENRLERNQATTRLGIGIKTRSFCFEVSRS